MYVQITYSVRVEEIPKELVKQLDKSIKISEKATFILEQLRAALEEDIPTRKISSGPIITSVEDLRQKLISLDMNLQNITGILSSYEKLIAPSHQTSTMIDPEKTEPENDLEDDNEQV